MKSMTLRSLLRDCSLTGATMVADIERACSTISTRSSALESTLDHLSIQVLEPLTPCLSAKILGPEAAIVFSPALLIRTQFAWTVSTRPAKARVKSLFKPRTRWAKLFQTSREHP